LYYASLGWEVFPIKPRTKRDFYRYTEYPNTELPLEEERRNYSWKYQARSDPARVRRFWTDHPGANIGCATGQRSGGLYVLDLDKAKEGKAAGEPHFMKYINAHNAQEDIDTPRSITGSGGVQLFFRSAEKMGSTAAETYKGYGVDTRGDGGFVVLPPSTHPCGKNYEWYPLYDPDETPAREMTDTIKEYYRGEKAPQKTGPDPQQRECFMLPDHIGEGSRTDTLVRYIGSLCGRCPKLGEDEIKVIVREINSTLCTPPLSDRELQREVFPAIHKFKISADFAQDDPEPVQTDKTPEEYLNETAAAAVGGFMTNKANHPEPIPTGWRALDDILGGGLYPGLYALGAQSSFGKTTFAEQLAVRLSETGHDVLFFSLEMARYELIARGISRLTACLECGKKGYTTVASAVNEKNKRPLQNARTAVDMINPQTFLHLNHDQQQLVTEAAALYRERTRHMWILAEDEDGQHTRLNVEAINRRVEEHNAITGAYPVVFVDYLQIIAGSDQKTDKANIDDIITRLRKMSRGKYPVVVVSSFNRNNYYTEASMAAFKESGSIEYSADVLLALEPRNMNDNTTPTATAKNKDAVKDTTNMETWPVQLSVLKNRLGRRDVAINFDYTAKFNIYEEVGRAERQRKEKNSEKKPTAYAALIKEVRDLRIDLMDATTAMFMRTNPGAPGTDPQDE
jgi:replicative DNA helicase